MKALDSFARMLGLQPRDAEDALHSERAARFVLTRRGFLGASALVGAAALLAEGQAFSFASPTPLSSVHLVGRGGEILRRWLPGERVSGFSLANFGPDISRVELRRVGSAKDRAIAALCVYPGNAMVWQPPLGEHVVA